jgi:uncharacterized protein (TIGR02145 family)
MRKLFYLSAILFITLDSCSKKNETPKPSPVTIAGQTYNTAIIGSQSWTTANYDGPGGVYYNDDPANAAIYGKLYTFAEAKTISLPAGWRLPAADDFKALYTYEGGKLQYQTDNPLNPDVVLMKLMSSAAWAEPYGTNTSGFNAVGGGIDFPANPITNRFNWLGYKGQYLTTSVYENLSYAHYTYFINNAANDAYNPIGFLTYNDDQFPVSLRFVKDN